MYWQEKTKDIGSVIEGSKTTIVFHGNMGMPGVESVQASCGCTEALYDKKLNILTVKFKAPAIPKHINSNSYIISKKINIYYDGGKMDQLSFKCTIIRK